MESILVLTILLTVGMVTCLSGECEDDSYCVDDYICQDTSCVKKGKLTLLPSSDLTYLKLLSEGLSQLYSQFL